MDSVVSSRRAPAPGWLVWVCLWIVYLVWGSTYLAIRVTVETLPPLFGMGVRFVVAGTLMYGWLFFRKGRDGMAVSRRQLVSCALVGAALLFGGNGMVAVAEQNVTSSLAALILGAIPLWVVVLRKLSGDRISWGTLAGVGAGFTGVAVLVVPRGASGGTQALAVGLMLVASLSWASGSFASGRLELPQNPFVSTSIQMILGGAVLLIAGALRGELVSLNAASFSRASLLALVYLIFVGSLLAFTAYTWLLQNAPLSKVSTYAYVNPVVAVFLGWSLLSEEITLGTLGGAVVIVASVAFIVRHESTPQPDRPRPLELAAERR
ncbi:MAG: EamA family transporter [Actinobacteria bacterium]|nr:EamA family transporter [Actinomycetota bacterium]